jgi:type I thyroxine 5'-deiodinase
MYRRYRDRASFFVVYIREAHPSDLWQMGINVRENVVYESPENVDERADLANICVRNLGIEFPALVDSFDNATDLAYSGWPDRLYVIDRDGTVAYKSAPGPFGFKPDEMERALAGLVGAPVGQ